MRRLAIAMTIILFARVVPAQTPAPAPQDPAAAAELFRQGRAALEAKDYPLACAKLRESLRLDVPHVGTLISLAVCEEATGKLAGARLHWQQAADLARGRGDERAEYCAQQLAAIDKRVPRLTIRIAPGAPAGTFVLYDQPSGEELARNIRNAFRWLGAPVRPNSYRPELAFLRGLSIPSVIVEVGPVGQRTLPELSGAGELIAVGVCGWKGARYVGPPRF